MTKKISFKLIINKILLSITLFIVFAIIGLIALFITAPIINDLIAKKNASEIATLPLPENTEYIETIYKSGKLVGNGNGMQYFGAILIKSELPLDVLKDYFSTFAENEWDYLVESQPTSEITVIENTSLEFITNIDTNNYYIVYSWGSNNTIFHELDLRGH